MYSAHTSDGNRVLQRTVRGVNTDVVGQSGDQPPVATDAQQARERTVESAESSDDQGAIGAGPLSRRPASPPDRRFLTPILGSVLTIVGLLVGSVVGFDLYAPGPTAAEQALAYALLVPYYLVSVRGTLWLFDDAADLATTNASWQPDPWRYVALGGGVAGAGIFAALATTGGLGGAAAVTVAAGALFVGSLMASVVAGPLYLLQRRRHLGTP